MKNYFLLLLSMLLIMFHFNVWASDEKVVTEEVFQKLIPEKLKNLKMKSTTRSEVQKIWGKPDLTELSRDYYSIAGVKYPVEFTFDRTNRLSKIYYRFVEKNPPQFESLSLLIGKHPVVDASKDPGSQGQFFIVKIPERKLILKFRNNKSKDLDTLVLE